MERCHSKGKNSQEGFACCSDSRSLQNAFPFLLWRNADWTCSGTHFLIRSFVPEFRAQGSQRVLHTLFFNAHYEQGAVPISGRLGTVPSLTRDSQLGKLEGTVQVGA